MRCLMMRKKLPFALFDMVVFLQEHTIPNDLPYIRGEAFGEMSTMLTKAILSSDELLRDTQAALSMGVLCNLRC